MGKAVFYKLKVENRIHEQRELTLSPHCGRTCALEGEGSSHYREVSVQTEAFTGDMTGNTVFAL